MMMISAVWTRAMNGSVSPLSSFSDESERENRWRRRLRRRRRLSFPGNSPTAPVIISADNPSRVVVVHGLIAL